MEGILALGWFGIALFGVLVGRRNYRRFQIVMFVLGGYTAAMMITYIAVLGGR